MSSANAFSTVSFGVWPFFAGCAGKFYPHYLLPKTTPFNSALHIIYLIGATPVQSDFLNTLRRDKIINLKLSGKVN